MKSMSLPKIIEGKWNKGRYSLIRELGTGGIGQIYLVRSLVDNKLYALKLSKDTLSLNREYRHLKHFSDLSSIVKTHEIDDLEIGLEIYNFIVLDYIEGANIKNYIDNRNLREEEALGLIMIVINALDEIHGKGFILGDLKPENIMLDEGAKTIKLVDLGGVVKKGEGIKEYTPAYDRACWGKGLRKAEESYDYFSALMLLVRLLLKRNINPYGEGIEALQNSIRTSRINEKIIFFVLKQLKNHNIENNFLEDLKDLYILMKNNRKYEIMIRRDKVINALLTASIFIFITTAIMLIIRI